LYHHVTQDIATQKAVKRRFSVDGKAPSTAKAAGEVPQEDTSYYPDFASLHDQVPDRHQTGTEHAPPFVSEANSWTFFNSSLSPAVITDLALNFITGHEPRRLISSCTMTCARRLPHARR
jgi:hypothetical protein